VSRTRVTAVAAAGALLLLGTATAASAGDGDPHGGLWYYDVPDFDTIHQQTQGQGITIGVVDTSIDPSAPDLAGADLTVHEPSYCGTTRDDRTRMPATGTTSDSTHATRMTSIILGNGSGIGGHPGTKGVAPKAKVISYAILVHPDAASGSALDRCPLTTRADGEPVDSETDVIDQAIADHVNILSMSWSANLDTFSDAIARAQHAGIIVVASADDKQKVADQPLEYPARYNGVVAVDGLSASGAPGPYNDKNELLTVLAPGEDYNLLTADMTGYDLISGSSNATAFTSAALALVWSKYPKATANQILWDLVHNTDAQDHPFQHSATTGYGVVNVRHMLAHDPTSYPDQNPLVSTDPDRKPTAAQIADPPGTADGTAGGASASASAPAQQPGTADAEPGKGRADAATAGSHGSSSIPLVVGGIAALVLVAGIVAGVLVARRRVTADAAEPQTPVFPRSGGAQHDD
jgi:hypothetical protein